MVSLNATMRGAILTAPYTVSITDLPLPTIQAQTDALVRITTAAMCGSDLHFYHGFSGGDEPLAIGHEAVGYVSEIGSDVTSLTVGDYVVIPDIAHIGEIDLGTGYSTHAELPVFGSGISGLGGLQSEYARVPFADLTLVPVHLTHNTTSRSLEQNYLTLSDIFSTAWTAISLSGFEAGDTVAVFGAGPVGLLAAYSAILRGASRVYSVDRIPMRLSRASSIGSIPINFNESDPVGQILSYEPNGVVRAVDCVGMEAVDAEGNPDEGNVLSNMVNVVAAGGGIGQIGVYHSQSNTVLAPYASEIPTTVSFPLSTFFSKGLSYKCAAVDPKNNDGELLRLIESGVAKPNFVGTAEIGIEQVPEYYQRFSNHEEIKVFIHFP